MMARKRTVSINDLPPLPFGRQGWPWTEESPELGDALSGERSWPRISIITPSYNQAQFIEETIRSVLLQGYANLEYIIIDGGSTDNTIEIIKKYEPWIAYWVSEPDHGQSHALNKGLERATGDWIAWINADDIYMQGAVSAVVKAITETYNSISWVVGTTFICDQKLIEIDRFKPNLGTASEKDPSVEPQSWVEFVCTKRSGVALPQPSSFWRRNAVNEVGGINEALKYTMDHELYGKLAYHGFRPKLIDKPLACFRTHDEQKTKDFPVEFWKEELYIVRNWEKGLTGTEKSLMNDYGYWLERQIRYYPFKLFKQKAQTQYRYIRKLLFGNHKAL